MDVRQIRSFILAADLGSLSKAAERSYISVQSLSQQVRILEREVGASLLERGNRGVSLTGAGAEFLVRARRAVCLLDEGIEAACALAQQERVLRIGCDRSYVAPWLARACVRAQRTFPGSVKLVEMRYAKQIGAVSEGAIDACVLVRPARSDDGDVAFERLRNERVFCLVASNDELAGLSSIPIDALSGRTVFYFPDDPSTPTRLIERLADAGARLVNCEGHAINLSVAAASANAVLLEYESFVNERMSVLAPIPLDCESRELGVFYRKENPAYVAIREFIAALKDEIRAGVFS